MLRVSRTFDAPRERVFRAWTHPDNLRRWWGISEGYTAPITEVDLRVGGRYRLGMQAPDSDQVNVVSGVFREIEPPERIVFTWSWESEDQQASYGEQATVVTLEFHDRDGSTELVLTHEYFPDEDTCNQHRMGWTTMLEYFGTKLPTL
jgi:uncharacterized protein YndB with AHSA1/START domain